MVGLQADTDVRKDLAGSCGEKSPSSQDANRLVRVKVEVPDLEEEEEENSGQMTWQGIKSEHEVRCMLFWPSKNVRLPPHNDERTGLQSVTGQSCRPSFCR
jgi:hypothetical protein